MDSSDPQHFGLLVIGSGPAGVHAVAAYVRAGGPGPVGLLSADPDEPYQRPPLSKAVLAGEEPPERTPILDDEEDLVALARAELRLGTPVSRVDTARRVVLTEAGAELGYDRLVLASGAAPTALPGTDAHARVFALRTLAHGRRLVAAAGAARSAVVVGSGFIGCEAAASLARRGVRTTLVTPEPAPQVARLGDRAGDLIAGWLADAGVELRTGVQVEVVRAPGLVVLDDGAEIEADLVLAAVGVTPATDFLTGSGLELEHGRVVVGDGLQVEGQPVWAAGDVARGRHAVADRPLSVEHWGDATAMGRLVGRNAAAYGPDGVGEPGHWSDAPGFWSEIGDHTLKYSAWGDGYERAEVVEHGDGAVTIWYADAAGELVGVLTHERDEDYERGGDLLAQRASLTEALDLEGAGPGAAAEGAAS